MIQLLEDFVIHNPYWGFPPEPHWGTSIPRSISVAPPLSIAPGSATVLDWTSINSNVVGLLMHYINKCIGDDTKAAARQSLNCIKNKKNKYGAKRFSIWRMEFLHPAMWHDHDIDFARWLHLAMWHVALESWQWIHQVAAPCNVIRGSEMTCHWIRPNVRHIGILHRVSI